MYIVTSAIMYLMAWTEALLYVSLTDLTEPVPPDLDGGQSDELYS